MTEEEFEKLERMYYTWGFLDGAAGERLRTNHGVFWYTAFSRIYLMGYEDGKESVR